MQPQKEGNGVKSSKKRRTTGSIHDRRFKCGCGRAYLSYPALYTHIKNKHDNIHPANTVIPRSSQKRSSTEISSEEEPWRGQLGALREILAFLNYLGFSFPAKSDGHPDFIALIENANFLTATEIKTLKSLILNKENDLDYLYFEIANEISKFLSKEDFEPIFAFLLLFRKEMLNFCSNIMKAEIHNFENSTVEFFTEPQLSTFCNYFFTKKFSLLKTYCPNFKLIKKGEIAEENCTIIFIKLLTDFMAEQGVIKSKIEINSIENRN